MPDVEAIAAKLTAEAKAALALFDTSELNGLLIPEAGDEAAFEELFKAGCIGVIRAAGHIFVQREELGQQVRAHLIGGGHG